MYVELQLSAQHVIELQRKQDPRAANIHTSGTATPPTFHTFTSEPGLSSSQFSPQRPRTRLNSKDCTCLSESATHTQACSDQFSASRSSPAVIESFVSHSPGFYSGTFSGERVHHHIWVTKVDMLDLSCTSYLSKILSSVIRHLGFFSSEQHQPTSAWHCYHSADPRWPPEGPLLLLGASACTLWSPLSRLKGRRRAKQSRKQNSDRRAEDWPTQNYFWWA